MADVLGSIFTRYGIWAIIGVVVLGLVVWAASDLRAQPGSKVSVLWGMTSYKKSCSRGAEGACKEEDNRCAKIGGRWEGRNPASNSIVRINFNQNRCIVYGSIEHEDPPNSQELSAALSDSRGYGFNKRTNDGCTTYLSNSYEVLSENQLIIWAFGNGCDLHNWLGDEITFNKIQ